MKAFALTILLGCLSCAVHVAAQDGIVRSLERRTPGQGVVTIHQDPHIAALIGHTIAVDSEGNRPMLKTSGYRVQVYAGNNTGVAKNEAQAIDARLRDRFPEFTVYTSFISPRWICRVGDFASIEEADVAMRRLRAAGGFKEVAIVKDQINIPL
jgi:hypothetical protein